MKVTLLLLLSKGLLARMVLYQPQDVLFVRVSGLARISCESNESLDGGISISWLHRKWGAGDTPTIIKSCKEKDHDDKYKCVSDSGHRITLEIHNVQEDDSGVYYCARYYGSFFVFANGTRLMAGESFSKSIAVPVLGVSQTPLPDTSVHVLGSAKTLLANASIQLTCVVRGARHMLHVTWNISGIRHTGRMITMEDPAGNRTFLNHISIPRDAWDHGEGLSCDVCTHSSPVSDLTERPEIGHRGLLSACSIFLRVVLTGILLLAFVLSIHLSWTYIPGDPQQHPPTTINCEQHPDGAASGRPDQYIRNDNPSAQ